MTAKRKTAAGDAAKSPRTPRTDPDPRIRLETWGRLPNYACTGAGCRYSSLDRAATLTHVAHCGRIQEA